MAYIGAKHPVFAPILTEPGVGFPTYGPGLVVGRAIEMNEAIEYNAAPLYSDDGQGENNKSFRSGTYTANLDDISRAVKKLWFGMQEATVNGAAALGDAVTFDSPYGGFGFYRVRTKASVRTIEAHWYWKTKWTRPNNQAKTKGEQVEWQTPTCNGEIIMLDNVEQSWHHEAEFGTEAEAVAWLDGLAEIATPNALELSSSTPADAATGVSKTDALTLNYNNAMSAGRTRFMLMRNDTGAKVAVTVAWSADGKTATLTHAALQASTAHTLIVMAVDVAGQTLDTALDFTTAA